ncbi:hypothetical protein CC2G_000347 [Coprinopsis cinerea AmutBmut pab1-1]|nr:hypothetical protein CC2G_000347 [Coprinopsis cinerea AmutBmut pab1-1]
MQITTRPVRRQHESHRQNIASDHLPASVVFCVSKSRIKMSSSYQRGRQMRPTRTTLLCHQRISYMYSFESEMTGLARNTQGSAALSQSIVPRRLVPLVLS